MRERQFTRIDTVREFLDNMLKSIHDEEVKRNGYVHLYGVGQACALIALHKGHSREFAELIEIAGMLHDYSKYKYDSEENHPEKSSLEVKPLLAKTKLFTENEIKMICNAIKLHSNKERIDTEFDEILKDADKMQHCLRNPMEDCYFNMLKFL